MHLDDWLKMKNPACSAVKREAGGGLRANELDRLAQTAGMAPREKPWGAGEPTAAVVPSAISNAVFDATGARLRSVSFTPAKVKAAIDRT
jgi:hypothetical protein